MWRREEEIFGSTEFPSPLRVQVEASKVERWLEPFVIQHPGLKYLLFPSIENKQRLAQEGIKFRMDLTWENERSLGRRRAAQNICRARQMRASLPEQILSLDQDIELATRAWLTFGGVGGRTRRGCGALVVKNPPPTWNVGDVQNWLRQFLQPNSGIDKILCLNQPMSFINAWKHVAELWKNFRQPGPARRGEPRRRFPEAEAIRRITGRRTRGRRVVPEDEVPSGFPRAELGLPIIFQFKDTTDPKPTTVNPFGGGADGRQFQRMGSPFILKPLVITQDSAVPMIVLLKAPRVSYVCVSPTPQGDQVFSVLGSPIIDSPGGSAIEAFLKFADSAKFREVTR